jgi:two-component system cell cycle sensor histidine kinase/response regulator CckA
MTEQTMIPEELTPARRLQLLREILGGAHRAPNVGSDAAGRKHILVVDDEHVVLTITSRVLKNAGYGVLEATSAREALRLLEQRESLVDLVLTDVVMPETDGCMLGRLIAERYPRLPVAYMSAYPASDLCHRDSPGPNLPFLSKPFSPESLLALVDSNCSRAMGPD